MNYVFPHHGGRESDILFGRVSQSSICQSAVSEKYYVKSWKFTGIFISTCFCAPVVLFLWQQSNGPLPSWDLHVSHKFCHVYLSRYSVTSLQEYLEAQEVVHLWFCFCGSQVTEDMGFELSTHPQFLFNYLIAWPGREVKHT